MTVNPDLRNQHTTIDAKRAKNRQVSKCLRCGIDLSRNKKYCAPCSNANQMERLSAYMKRYNAKKAEFTDKNTASGSEAMAKSLTERQIEHRENLAKAEAAGKVADSTDVRMALVKRMEAGELTLEQVQAELRSLQRGAKKRGMLTRAQAYRG